MDTLETIRYFADLVQHKGIIYAKNALNDAGVDREIILALEEVANAKSSRK